MGSSSRKGATGTKARMKTFLATAPIVARGGGYDGGVWRLLPPKVGRGVRAAAFARLAEMPRGGRGRGWRGALAGGGRDWRVRGPRYGVWVLSAGYAVLLWMAMEEV